MLNRILDRLMLRFAVLGFVTLLGGVLSLFGHAPAPKAAAAQDSNPWAPGYVAPSGPRPADLSRSRYGAYAGRDDSEAAKDEAFRREMLHRMREASEVQSQGVNAPTYHEN